MKQKRTRRDRLRRSGNFWTEGMPLTEKDRALLRPLIAKAAELGYTPIVSEVSGANKIKDRFRCWKDAVTAAGLPSQKDPEQVRKRMMRNKANESEKEQPIDGGVKRQ